MALYTKTGSVIPSDAVRLSKGDAITFQRNIIDSWKHLGDVFFLKYGPGILSAASALSGMYFNNYFRHRMRLQSFARLTTYLPVVVFPTMGSFLLQTKIQDSIIIQEYQCPVCLEIKGSSFQIITGALYPAVLAPTSSFMMATRYHTYPMPNIAKEMPAAWKLLVKLCKPLVSTFTAIVAGHAILAAFIIYKQADNVHTVNSKLEQLENEFSSK